MQLAKIFCFRNFLNEEANKPHRMKNIHNYIYLINKKIINQYLSYFNYKELYNALKGINIDSESLKSKYETLIEIIKTKSNDFYKEIKEKEKKEFPHNFIGNEYHLIPQSLDYSGKKLYYLSDFEIVNKDIFEFFKKNKMMDLNQVIIGEYIAEDSKIFLSYEFEGKNYYEIGSFEKETMNFIIEYIIGDNNSSYKKIIDNFNSLGIKYLLGFKNENTISTRFSTICYCYDFPKDKKNVTNSDLNSIQDNEYNIEYNIKNIISILMSLYLFEKEIKNKLELSKSHINDLNYTHSNPFSTICCKLVNSKFLSEIKNIFYYTQIKEIISKNKIYIKEEINNNRIEKIMQDEKTYKDYLLNKKNDFLNLRKTALNILDIEEVPSKEGIINFSYPMKFNIIKESLFDKFLELFGLKQLNKENYMNKSQNILVTFNNGCISFRGFKTKNCENETLIYIYKYNEQQEADIINYTPEVIIDLKMQHNLLYGFSKIMKINVLEEINKSQSLFETKYDCNVLLLFDDNKIPRNTGEINEQNPDNNIQEKNLTKLLSISYRFCSEYTNFYESIKLFQKQPEENIYLINKNYIDEVKKLLHFNEVNSAIKDKIKIKEFFESNDINYLSLLKQSLIDSTLTQFRSSTLNDLTKKLDEHNLYDKTPKYLDNYKYDKLFYYENFQLINQKLFDVLDDLDDNFKLKCISTKLIISKDKAIILVKDLENYLINIGSIGENNEFITHNIIQSMSKINSKFDIERIFDFIKKYQFDKFESKFIQRDLIFIKINEFNISAEIFSISYIKSISSIDSKTELISEKLKALLFLAIAQINAINNFKEFNKKKTEKIYLMNYNYLKQYKFDEIFSLINQIKDIDKISADLNYLKDTYVENRLEEIIPKINQQKLKKMNQELSYIDLSQTDWKAKYDTIKLKNRKTINIYKNFIIIKEKIFNEIKFKLSISSSTNPIEYINAFGRDVLAITDYSNPHILIGNLFNNNQFFDLSYIIDLDMQSYIQKEIDFIKENRIENYIAEKTVLDVKNKKDFISPILINYDEILKEDFSLYINNENLNKVLKLYNFYMDFKAKMNDKYESEKKYYLINKDVMNGIKKDFNYDIIISILNKIQSNKKERNKNKEILYILKNLPVDIYEKFIKNKNPIEKRMKQFISPQKISITIPNSPNDFVQIYNQFEILDSSTASEFIDNIYEYSSYGYGYGIISNFGSSSSNDNNENYIECTLKDRKIIVYYPKNKFNNDKYAYTIGSLNNENTFIAEYLIIYTRSHAYFDDIKNDLNNYLKSIEQQLIYGPYPLVDNKYEEIGKVIGLNKLDNSNFQIVDIGNNGNISPQTFDNSQNGFNGNNNEKHSIDKRKKKITIEYKDYNLDTQVQTPKIKSLYSRPPLMGLDNIGATCYMNATLQCLCNIPKFVDYFKFNKNLIEKVRNDLNNGNINLSSSFKLLIEKLWPDRLYFYNSNNKFTPYNNISIGSHNTFSNKKNESYAPREFKEKISNLNELFQGVQANDAKDLVNFLIMTLHTELNTVQSNNMNNNAINLNQTNQQLMFKIFSEDFMKNNKSIISDLFYGVNYNVIQCQGCMTKSFNYQTYFFFVFPLEEVRIFKSQNNFNNNNFNNFNYNMNFNNNDINIYDCFLYEQRINYMTGQNAMYCNYCKQTCNSSMCTLLAFGPEIIIVILNRGQGIQYKVKINFPIELNLYNFIDFKDTGFNYELIGVITHMGGSDMSGHFIAYCKNPINNTWYQYNDSVVNEVNQYNFKAEVVDYAMPYLLFYQKVNK